VARLDESGESIRVKLPKSATRTVAVVVAASLTSALLIWVGAEGLRMRDFMQTGARFTEQDARLLNYRLQALEERVNEIDEHHRKELDEFKHNRPLALQHRQQKGGRL
jgi:hypothetical protein